MATKNMYVKMCVCMTNLEVNQYHLLIFMDQILNFNFQRFQVANSPGTPYFIRLDENTIYSFQA